MLPEVRQPVLLVCGDRDVVTPLWMQDELLAGLPNVGRVVVEGCGHVPGYSHPEVLAEVVRQFLTPPT
jgi:pimeloyl-ACP methyl ester carboxylesterase